MNRRNFLKTTFTALIAVIIPLPFTKRVDLHDGEWHHVLVTRKADILRIYVDGVEVPADNYAQVWNKDLQEVASDLRAGSRFSVNIEDGNLDELKITEGSTVEMFASFQSRVPTKTLFSV